MLPVISPHRRNHLAYCAVSKTSHVAASQAACAAVFQHACFPIVKRITAILVGGNFLFAGWVAIHEKTVPVFYYPIYIYRRSLRRRKHQYRHPG
jgi:hypothetical protein